MASLTPKVIKGRTYYYARECQRVNGKPKITKTIYLGSLDSLIAAVQGAKAPPRPQSVDIAALGDVAALYDIAQDIGLVSLIDQVLPKRRGPGPTVGQYLLLAAINRAVCPTSKAKLASWYGSTCLTRLIPATGRPLTSQAFWNHMNRVAESHIEAIEQRLSARLIEQYGLSLRTLTYDGTNFFTYINTRNPAQIPQRGHNKQKRNDLRQVSLGMLVSTDFHVPLFHKVYQGNVTDATIFKTVTEELRQRYADLAKGCEHITLVFDKGNNSADAFSAIDESDFHFVGSLVPTHHADLLQIPLDRFEPLQGNRLKDCLAYRIGHVVFGQPRTVVVTYNENLLQGQLQGLTTHMEKARKKLRDIQTKLRRRREGKVKGGKKPTMQSVQSQIDKALSGQFMKSLFCCHIEPGDPPTLTYRTDPTALARLVRTQFGKTLLFTDNHDWSNEDIVLAYRAQHHIEDAFRDMKNPHFLGWSPMYHWTDQKIRVHAFYCVLALTLSSLLQRRLHHAGMDLSIPRMFELLGGIRETLVIYPRRPGQRKPPTASALSTLCDEQQKLYEILDLGRHLPA